MPALIAPLTTALTVKGREMNWRVAPTICMVFNQEAVAEHSQADGIINQEYDHNGKNNSNAQDDQADVADVFVHV